MCPWWSGSNLCLHACHVIVIVGNSGLCLLGGVYLTCIYMHVMWSLSQTIPVSVVVGLVICVTSVERNCFPLSVRIAMWTFPGIVNSYLTKERDNKKSMNAVLFNFCLICNCRTHTRDSFIVAALFLCADPFCIVSGLLRRGVFVVLFRKTVLPNVNGWTGFIV